MRAKHLLGILGIEFTKDSISADRNVGNREIITQQKIEIHVVLPFGAATKSVGFHGCKLEQRRKAEESLELGGRFYGKWILEKCQLDIVDHKVHLFGNAASNSVLKRCSRNPVKIALVVDGRGLKQIEVNGAAMPDIQRQGRSPHEVVLATELCQERQQLSLPIVEYLAMHTFLG